MFEDDEDDDDCEVIASLPWSWPDFIASVVAFAGETAIGFGEFLQRDVAHQFDRMHNWRVDRILAKDMAKDVMSDIGRL